ncbi:GBF-interacting protein 1-like isoform X1 [Sesamum indicum]|uniref:GBF-interacting protein 1-like isoform X1 n=1 Tax=Sesamum indicum TaxID=4182 RepID=A0A8M8VCG0_SESIN|nr:GBF-interacting protein 1-like isoform X1 [Sesamum indicum]
MSTSRGSGAGNGGGVQAIPAGSRKMVQSLKEIVNCSEAEIYATLKDCNMDPNEAVNRLLSQDPFHEVKSKREKKKEGKDTTETRSRSANNNSSRGGKIGADRYHGRGGSTPYSSESASLPGRSSYKKENGSTPNASYLSSGNNRSRGPAGPSDGASSENKVSSLSMADAMPSGVQPTSGYQSAWVSVPGQVSMADIVKMGRPQNKVASAPNASHHNIQGSSASASHHNLRFPEDHVPKDPELGIAPVQHVSTNEEWPSIEKPPVAKVNPIPEHKVDSDQHLESSGVLSDSINQAEEVQETKNDNMENSGANDMGSKSISTREIPEDDSGGASLFENDLYNNMGSYSQQAHDFHEDVAVEEIGASVSSVTRNLQQLSVQKDDGRFPSEEYAPSVVIPDHLQVQSADCSHLSFGSFGSGMSAAYSSGNMTSVPVKTNEEPHSEPDISSVGHPDARSSEYYVDDSLRNAPDGGLFHRTGANAGSYDPSSASQPEELKPENAEVAHGNQYPFPSSNSGYAFDNGQHLNASFSQTSSQMQNLAPFPNSMQSYTNSLPSALSPANVHPSRESDLQYSPFPVTQSTSSKYGNSVSSISGSAISMPEALKTAGFPSTQPAQQTLSGTNVATGPPLPQHLAVHPYSQPTLPLGPFTNMIGYPFLPQSYTYMPSAFQQTFSGNSTYHQSLAALLPQYKNNVSASSLPQSAAIASGYGAFGNTPTIPGNFPMNPPAGPSGTTLSYDDVLNSQYKDSSHLVSLQQNENPALWLHGANSRTMSAVPASTYYNYQGQNQQTGGGMRQAQQPSQNYGSLGYPNFYHSQTGIALDQQQNPRDAPLGGSQGQPKQSQIWQNSY